MKPKVAKIPTRLLKNSNFEVAKRMAGSGEFKYLTESQVSQLERYGLKSTPLSEKERIEVNNRIRAKSSKLVSKCKITYEDEEGIHEVIFKTEKEADSWIKFQNTLPSSGAKFELLSKELITPSRTSSRTI